MQATVTAPETQRTHVPANTLVRSRRNVRKTYLGRHIRALAASILRQGLLQNLVVTRKGDTYPVEAGERRRQAIAWLVKKRKLPPDWPVAVRIVDESDSIFASLSENIHHERMHPADEFTAFNDLFREGWTIDEIAEVFGVTALVVERRLSLARAAPALMELFRADKINLEQLKALCTTDDHERQLSAWQNAPTYNRNAFYLRRAVLTGEVEVTADSRVAFIGGVDAFIAAGGEVRRDLFSVDGQGGFITDVGLLEQLVAQKLEAAATEVRREEWGWVEVWRTWEYTDFHRLGRIQKTAVALPADVEAKVEALRAEHDELSAEWDRMTGSGDDLDELPEAEREQLDTLWERLEAISGEIAACEEAHQAYEPLAMAAAGAIVGMDNGRLRIERGLVRASDRTKLAEAVGGTSVVSGGRETAVPGRKAGTLSDPLTRSLFGYRNLAAQTVTAGKAHVAKVLLATWIVQTLRHRHYNVPLDLRIADGSHGTRTGHPIADEGGEARRKEFDGIGAALIASLPTDEDALWDALMQATGEEIDNLIAFAVASAVSLDRKHTGLTAKLLAALDFDMADHFTATASNYLGRVSKAQIVEALGDAGKVTDDAHRGTLAGLKKGDLAAHAEAGLANTRWVPALIRTPVPPPAAPAAKPKAERKRARKPREAASASNRTAAGGPAPKRARGKAPSRSSGRSRARTPDTPGQTSKDETPDPTERIAA
jgi:ParB family transcriptional regulator, chromosome partitioning protein